MGSAIHKQYSVIGWSESIHTARWMELCCGLCNTQTILSYWLERVNTHSQVDGAVLWALQYTNNTQLLVGASQYTVHKQYSVTGWSESIHSTQTILSYWLERVNTQYTNNTQLVVGASQYTVHKQYSVIGWSESIHSTQTILSYWERVAHVAAVGFLSRYLSEPYNHKLNKTFPSCLILNILNT